MTRKDQETTKAILPLLKADVQKTLEMYKKTVELRAKKIEQDMEQIKTYVNILENAQDAKLNPRVLKKLNKVLSWEMKSQKKTCRQQQDQIENHFLELQKSLVGLISKRFKY
jgi:hypothetical protein